MARVRVFLIILVVLFIFSSAFGGTIEVNSDITTNQLWTANNIYHITANVNIQALLVIEPNTLISFGGSGALFVNNGGTLISVGTPDEPIYYTSDSGNGWYDYYCAIYIESTASSATKIAYNSIDCAYIAIITDNIRLDRPIENNYLFYNSYGVFEYGTQHTDIINNLIYSGFNNEYSSSGIEVFMASSGNGSDANSYILIKNNTCDYQDYGIVVHGVADENNAGSVMLVNNIITQSYECGLNLVDGYMLAVVCNTGYGANYVNKNWEFEEYDSVETTQNPYVSGENYLDVCYLDQNSVFVNAGLEYIEQTQLIGKTTAVNGLPDNNFVDIGFHYPNWDFSNAGDGNTLQSDYDGNFKVDFKDFAILANGWQSVYDINDLSAMANEWLCTISGHPAISVSVNGDANNLSGEVGIGVEGCSYSTSNVCIFVDGQLIEKTDYDADEGMPGIMLNTPSYRNGNHSLKCVAIDYNNIITLSENTDVNFSNPLHCSNLSDTYEPNQPLRLLALNSAENNLQVKLAKWDGEVIWSQQTSGDLDITIPGSVLAGQIYDVSIEQEIGGERMLLGDSEWWKPVWEYAIAAAYDPNKPYKFAIILPNAWKSFQNSANSRKEAVSGIVYGCMTMGIPYIILYGNNCTWENFAKVISKPTLIYAYVVSRSSMYAKNPLTDIEVRRTHFRLSNDNYVLAHFESNDGQWPSNYHSMRDFGLGNGDKFKIVWIDSCFSGNGNYTGVGNDMAQAWMDLSDTPILDKLYVGWNNQIFTSNTAVYAAWSAFFWGDPDGFSWYGSNTYYQAFTRALIEVENASYVDDNAQMGTIGDIMRVRFTPYRYDY